MLKKLKNKFKLVLVLFIITIIPTYSQGKLIYKLKELNFKVNFYETLDLLKKRIDTTKAIENKVIYSKTGNVVYGLMYIKNSGSIRYFHENIFTKKIYYYILNPFIDITQEPIPYDKVITNLYSCYNVDFKNKLVNEYNVFFKNDERGIKCSTFDNDMETTSKIILNSNIILLPDFNNLKSIRNYNLNINKLKHLKKMLGQPRKVEDCSPLLFYFFVCMLEPCPIKCSEFDYSEIFN